VALSIAAVQSQSEAGAFDIANLPMVSYPQRLDAESLSEIPALQMHVLGGILRAKVFADGQYGDEKVQSIAFADENTPMAGAFKLDLTGLSDEASLIVTGLASRTAKTQLSIPYAVPSSQESAKDIYMILAPGTYDGTLSVTTEKAVYTQPFQCEMKRNACYDASINLSTAARESIDGWNGEGTAEAPYQVATAEDLQRLIALCNSDGGEYAEFADKHYLQIADIDMAQIAIQPIGLSEQSPFRGVYDGGGHTIGNFTLTNCESGACGLFGYLDGATVKDIHLEECEYSASGLHAGGVAGVAKQSVIRGCTFEGSLVGTAETEFDGYAVSDVGGIIRLHARLRDRRLHVERLYSRAGTDRRHGRLHERDEDIGLHGRRRGHDRCRNSLPRRHRRPRPSQFDDRELYGGRQSVGLQRQLCRRNRGTSHFGQDLRLHDRCLGLALVEGRSHGRHRRGAASQRGKRRRRKQYDGRRRRLRNRHHGIRSR